MPTKVTFSCEETMEMTSLEIAKQILDIENWSDFKGYGFLPGIKSARFDPRTPEVIGSKIHVTNCDNSSHIEEIVEWSPDSRLRLHFSQFSAPVSYLATGFDEIWEFERIGTQTKVVRSMELHCKSFLTWPILKVISILLKKALSQHLVQIKNNSAGTNQK